MKKSIATTPVLKAPKRKMVPIKMPTTPMVDVMIDLETLGTVPGCVVLSIGAVEFCSERGLGKELYVVINRPSQRALGLKENEDTISWWSKQSEAARQVLRDAEDPASLSVEKALAKLNEFLMPIGPTRVKVWGNGADFDNAILNCLYEAVGQKQPWNFWNNRCYRTLRNLVDGPKLERTGTYHNALDDAKTQALHAIELLRML